MNKTANKLTLRAHERAVRMTPNHEDAHSSDHNHSRRDRLFRAHAAGVRKAEVNGGKRTGVPTGLAERLKAVERKNRKLRLQREGFDLPAVPWNGGCVIWVCGYDPEQAGEDND